MFSITVHWSLYSVRLWLLWLHQRYSSFTPQRHSNRLKITTFYDAFVRDNVYCEISVCIRNKILYCKVLWALLLTIFPKSNGKCPHVTSLLLCKNVSCIKKMEKYKSYPVMLNLKIFCDTNVSLFFVTFNLTILKFNLLIIHFTGIGPKRAIDLIKQYKTIEEIVKNIDTKVCVLCMAHSRFSADNICWLLEGKCWLFQNLILAGLS